MSEFVNPYTFIPLGRRSSLQCLDDTERLTGVISCRLTTMIPLVIPAKKIKPGDPQAINPFFRIDGEPAIPGSALRGPIRSVYEALTDSCLRTGEEMLSSAGGCKLAGLLRYDAIRREYHLSTAKRYRVKKDRFWKNQRTGNDWVTGDEVHIVGRTSRNAAGIADSVSDKPGGRTVAGYYLRVNAMQGSNPSVFVEEERVKEPVAKEYVDALGENIALYAENQKNSPYPELYRKCFDRMRSGEATLPVWYSYERLGNGTYAFHFAWAQLSRSVYPTTPADFGRSLGLQPCSNYLGKPCPACSLFGFVNQTGGSSNDCKASKVRFTDAQSVGHADTQMISLPILATPKIGATEFYLRNKLHKNSFTPVSEGSQLAGRKMYWHSQKGITQEVEVTKVDDGKLASSRVEAVAKGAAFSFDVYFDTISKQQLNELVYAISLGQAWHPEEKTRWHKIGHGKPVGAGSVLIEVERVVVRSCDGSSYGLSPWDSYKLPLAGEEGKPGTVEYRLRHTREVLKVTDSTAIDASVVIDYPRVRDGGDIFDWFKDNHAMKAPAQTRSESYATLAGYREVLPGVLDESQLLHRSVKTVNCSIESVAHPSRGAAPVSLTGTVDSFRMMPDGRWSGWIKQDSGSSNIFFLKKENEHLGDGHTVGKGAKVSYETTEVLHKGKKQLHAINVRAV